MSYVSDLKQSTDWQRQIAKIRMLHKSPQIENYKDYNNNNDESREEITSEISSEVRISPS